LAGDVVLHEIHYEGPANHVREEFVELFNRGEAAVDLSGWFFSSGITYTFPPGSSLPAGGYLVVAEDPAVLQNALGYDGALGPYEGRLANGGERLTLRDAQAALQDEVSYDVGVPWPLASAGSGHSMELIHPELDNDLGSSWRPSVRTDPPLNRFFFLAEQESNWRYRKGTEPPSDPPSAWREPGFVEDSTWLTGQTSIGFGDDDDNTVLDDMLDNYSTVYLRHAFIVKDVAALPDDVRFGMYVDDAAIFWINGVEVARLNVDEGVDPAFDDRPRRSSEASWTDRVLEDFRDIVVEGENLLAIQVLNFRASSNDLSVDARIFTPGEEDFADVFQDLPTPGRRNSRFSESSPPAVRQVRHEPRQPEATEDVLVTCKVTDPEGVAGVELLYQVVTPGAYIPAFLPLPRADLLRDAEAPRLRNPDFDDPQNWTRVSMHDDGAAADDVAGDDTFSVMLPAQGHRTLVRYRITVVDGGGEGASVPYPDDSTLNFAYFVCNGVPDYSAPISVLEEPTVHPAEALTSVPVYWLLTRAEDFAECVASGPGQQIDQGKEARFAENWEGTFVYDGFVYDHINYRLRGANGRYQVPPGNGGAGKRHWRFKFNRADYLRVRDRWGNRYPTRWRVLNTGRMFGNRLDGSWGLGDQVNDIIWRAYDVPAPFGHVFHWRVIDDVEEAPAGADGQYFGDFFGLARAFENYDVRFLEAHNLPKGNLYKLVNQTQDAKAQQRYQAADAVADGRDHDNIESALDASQSAEWIETFVDYPQWYRYHTVAKAIRHHDYWPTANKNAAWYFHPRYTEANQFLGRLWTLPFDTDATWGPTWNSGIDRPYDAIFGRGGKAEFQTAYRNHLREVRDLLWQPEPLAQLIRQTAAFMDPLEEADIDRWRNAPASAGRQYFLASNQSTLEGKIGDMLAFAFEGGFWQDERVKPGGRAAFLDELLEEDAENLPATPSILYVGEPGFPIDGLRFGVEPFQDPQGSQTFRALEWRLAEVTPVENPGALSLSDPLWRSGPVHLELRALWKSEEIVEFQPEQAIPAEGLSLGRTYRVRARMKDDTDLWSHWSEPVEFATADPTMRPPHLDGLRVSEVMYNPPGGPDFEFIELINVGGARLDLREVAFVDGIEFAFAGSQVEFLRPREVVVVVKDLAVFTARYESRGLPRIAGTYDGRLDNAGDRVRLRLSSDADILDFTYDNTWHPASDGNGSSLNILDLSMPADDWSLAESWFPSSVLHGTPGTLDDGQPAREGTLPGDANRDGRVNLLDGILLLRILFSGGGPPALPCGGNDLSGANLEVLDADGSGAVELGDVIHLVNFLFQRGPRHTLGTSCIVLEGCRSACP